MAQRGRWRGVVVLAMWLALCPVTAGAWQVASRGTPAALAVASRGDLIVVGERPGRFAIAQLDVRRLARSGARRWRFRGAFGRALVVAVDPAGDVVVGGLIREGTAPPFFTVLKLDGRRGTERWRIVVPDGTCSALAIDGAGDVLAGGTIGSAFVVAKLAGSDGGVRWQRALPGTGGAAALAVEPGRDVVAAGGAGGNVVVWKLAGVDGGERWRQTTDPGAARGLALDAAGDVLIAAEAAGGFTVLRLAATDGAERWRSRLGTGSAQAVAGDGTGAVVAAGTLAVDGLDRFAVAKLDAAGGTEQWRQLVGIGAAGALALGADGTVAVTGTASSAPGDGKFTLVALSSDAGSIRWRRDVDGTPADVDTDRGVAVASGGDGTIAALGSVARGVGARRDERIVVLRLRAH